MNWHAGFSFCPGHLNSSVSADLTGNFLGISLIIPCRCVMHFKELSHHYLQSREAAVQGLPAAGQRRRAAWRGEAACPRSLADEGLSSCWPSPVPRLRVSRKQQCAVTERVEVPCLVLFYPNSWSNVEPGASEYYTQEQQLLRCGP